MPSRSRPAPRGSTSRRVPVRTRSRPLRIAFWDQAIDDGGANSNHIAATGSSDSHQAGDQGSVPDSILASPIGEATTVVFADELSESGIQEGVEAGHTYVKPFGQLGPDLRLSAAEDGVPMAPAIMGDTLESQTGFSATLSAEILELNVTREVRPGLLYAVVYRDTAPVLVVPIPPTGDTFEFDLPVLGYARYRIQVQREGAIEALSSPIYVEPVSGEPPPPPPTDCNDAPAVRLGSGDERFDGTPAPDRVAGQRGRDRIRGADGDDCLMGGRGRDRLTGDEGEDLLKSGGGSDRVRAVDGEADEVRCGTGRKDRARIDAGLDTTAGCERVREI